MNKSQGQELISNHDELVDCVSVWRFRLHLVPRMPRFPIMEMYDRTILNCSSLELSLRLLLEHRHHLPSVDRYEGWGRQTLRQKDFTVATHRSRSNQHGTMPEVPNTDYTIVTCTHPKQTPSTA